MPADLELALRVRADMREALQGIGALNRSLGDTALRGDEAGAALTGATGAAQTFTTALGALGRESGSTLGQARDAVESVFGAMESALARFVTTGRVSFSGFVDSVIADLARLATRRYITQPLGDLLFGALGGGATPGSAVFGRLRAGVGHTGAVAGQPGGVRRAVPPAVFALAPRFHSGGIAGLRPDGGIAGLRPDEVPIIAQAGEIILPRASGATLPRGAALAPSVEINFDNRGTPQREVSREVRLDPRGLVVSIVTDDIRRGGPIRQTMQRELGGGLP